MMRPIDLDFVRRRRTWPVWLMLALAALISTDVGVGYVQLRGELRDGGRRADDAGALPVSQEPVSEQTQREQDAARRILQELALPWESLFRSVEAAAGEDVALLSIEPDAGKGLVRITGEARDYLAALNFMVRLDEEKTLTRIHLTSHEIREDAPQRPYGFALAGHWRTAQ